VITSEVFSEYDIAELGIRIKGAAKADINKCVGSSEETMEQKTVTKKCRGVVAKKRTKGTGTGTVKLSLHMSQDLFADMYGMKSENWKDGVIAYGELSMHPEFCMTQKVLDEDDNVKYKAYPNCTIQSGISRKVESRGEEVAEIEIEVAVMPDENGVGMYEAVDSDVTDATLKTKWMEEFEPSLIKAVTA